MMESENQIQDYQSQLTGLTAYERHVKYINDFVVHYGKGKKLEESTPKIVTDYDLLRKNYRFLEESLDNENQLDWEKRMVLKYHAKLFKEYCLADLTRYKEGKIGLRWRTEQEVYLSKGQFICGNKNCDARDNLNSWEVNFKYVEDGEKKNTLVKLRACPDCAIKMNFKSKHKAEKKRKNLSKQQKRKKKKASKKESKEEKESNQSASSSSSSSDEAEHQQQNNKSEEAERQRQIEEANQVWKGKVEIEKTKEEEFDTYFANMFP